LAGVKTKLDTIGRYESEVEFYTLMKLMLRHFESLTVLAREDLVLAPLATLLRAQYMKQVSELDGCLFPLIHMSEVRWVLFLRSGTTQAKKLAESIHLPKVVSTTYEARRSLYAEFDTAICHLLKEMNYSIPNLWEMLKELKEPYLYEFYILLSAYSHSNFEAASLYKEGFGGSKKIGEFTAASDWTSI